MKESIFISIFSIGIAIIVFSCSGKSNQQEVFLPYGFKEKSNNRQKYPLIVTLHGATEKKDIHYIPPILQDPENIKNTPFFIYAPNANQEGVSYTWETAKDRVVSRIKELSEEYPIDINRLYLIGFSMGGSGSYIIAEHLYQKENFFFAGIIRIAGKSQTALSIPIIENTSIWYHVGLADSENIVNTAEMSLNYIEKLYNNYSKEQYVDNINNSERTNTIIKVDNKEIYKLSEYNGIGHSDETVFKDEALFSWLLSKNIRQ